MTFNDLHKDTTCNCLDGAKEDFPSTYGIKTDKPDLRINDFKTKWEKGQRPKHDQEGDCKIVSLLKGKSMSIVNDQNMEFIKSIYSQMGNLAPKYRRYMILMKFSEETGHVRTTPARENPHHHTFYKCDDFNLSNVQTQEIIEFVSNV